MSRFLVRRSFAALVALLVASMFVFAAVRSLPGDPALALSGEGRDPEANAAIRLKYGLDEPIPVQYLRWLSLALTGDLGKSIRTGQPVMDEIVMRLPVTLELAFLAGLVAVAFGIPLGIVAALRRASRVDYAASGIGLVGMSIPTFWLGIMLILVFAVWLDLLPASGYVPFVEDPIANLQRMILPAIVLGAGLGAVLLRQVRSAMIGSMGADYIRTARAKGLTDRQVVIGHALRNSLIPVVTILGLELGALISGSVVTESIFLIPGFGRLIIEAISRRDYPVIQGVALFSAVAYIVINLVVDVLYTVLNPRVRLSERQA
jgi:peptide/nickel transport system permease protein